jgi:hypothetical protein
MEFYGTVSGIALIILVSGMILLELVEMTV